MSVIYSTGPQKTFVGLDSPSSVKNLTPASLNSSKDRSPSLLVSIALNVAGAMFGSKPRISKNLPYSSESIIWSLLLK